MASNELMAWINEHAAADEERAREFARRSNAAWAERAKLSELTPGERLLYEELKEVKGRLGAIEEAIRLFILERFVKPAEEVVVKDAVLDNFTAATRDASI
jgi:hypothetical protein